MVNFLGMMNRNQSAWAKMQKFPRFLNLTDLGVTADVTLVAGQWSVVGSYTVPAQQFATWGSNDPTGGASVAGSPVYMRLDQATGSGTQINGKIRFAITNATQTNTIVVSEERTERLSADSTNDRTKCVLLPEYPTKAKEDSILQILFYVDGSSNITLDYNGTNTDARLPVTIYQ